MSIVRQVTLDRSNRKKDDSVSITFTTNLEQTSEEFMEIDKLNNVNGVIYFSERGNLTKEEADMIDKVDIEIEGKTKSQRLRNVLYVYCEQKGDDFKDFYDKEMERIIEHYKSKLD